MSHRRPVAVALLALVAVSVAVAADTAGHALAFPALEWKKGDLVELDGRLGYDLEFRPEGGEVTPNTKLYENDAWIATVRVDEVDTRGGIRRGVAHFPSGGVRPDRKEYDQSLVGARIALDGDRWSEAGGRGRPSRDVTEWLRDDFMRRCLPQARLEWTRALAPKAKVAPGDTWTADAAALARVLSSTWDCELAAEGAEATCTLESVIELSDSPVAFFDVEATFPMRVAPRRGIGKRLRLPKKAALRVTLRCQMGLEGRLPHRHVTAYARYWGDATASTPGRLNISLHAWWGCKVTDWMPEPAR